jgi:uncharacterized membrane protein YjdF
MVWHRTAQPGILSVAAVSKEDRRYNLVTLACFGSSLTAFLHILGTSPMTFSWFCRRQMDLFKEYRIPQDQRM